MSTGEGGGARKGEGGLREDGRRGPLGQQAQRDQRIGALVGECVSESERSRENGEQGERSENAADVSHACCAPTAWEQRARTIAHHACTLTRVWLASGSRWVWEGGALPNVTDDFFYEIKPGVSSFK
eukprot:2006043-Rhodomonas_salina.4